MAVAAATTFACGVPDQPSYGAPFAVNAGRRPAAQSDDGGAGGGTTGAATGTPTACTEASFFDGGVCAVTWSGDIFPKIQTTWKCGTATCHTITDPKFTAADSKSTYDALRAYIAKPGTNVAGLPYINPCSNDPAKSYFARNLAGTGGAQMPLGVPATADDQTKVATWVACGAPFN